MARITSNSGTTFTCSGGTVGVQINTNTNWKFYLRERSSQNMLVTPSWLHINGNASDIVGSESQFITCEAEVNTSTSDRYASGICESLNESALTAWTGFLQYGGPSGGTQSGVYYGYSIVFCTSYCESGNVGKNIDVQFSLDSRFYTLRTPVVNIHVGDDYPAYMVVNRETTYGGTYVTQPMPLYIQIKPKTNWVRGDYLWVIEGDSRDGNDIRTITLPAIQEGDTLQRAVITSFPSLDNEYVELETNLNGDRFYIYHITLSIEA